MFNKSFFYFILGLLLLPPLGIKLLSGIIDSSAVHAQEQVKSVSSNNNNNSNLKGGVCL